MNFSSVESLNDHFFPVDIGRLRKDLMDDLSIAAYVVSPAIFEEVSEIERASSEELIEKALELRWDIHKYIK